MHAHPPPALPPSSPPCSLRAIASSAPRAHPPPPPLPFSTASRLRASIVSLLDRSNPASRAYQDLGMNVALFAAAVLLINRFGHKLAV